MLNEINQTQKDKYHILFKRHEIRRVTIWERNMTNNCCEGRQEWANMLKVQSV
jgi:hypothetical protein